MPKQYTPEVKSRAVSYVMDRMDRYKSVYAACAEMAPKLNVGKETLRRWVLQAQVDAGDRTGPSSEELAEIKALKSKVKDLEEANEILKQSAIFFARELCATRRCVSRGGERPSWLGRRSGLIKLGAA